MTLFWVIKPQSQNVCICRHAVKRELRIKGNILPLDSRVISVPSVSVISTRFVLILSTRLQKILWRLFSSRFKKISWFCSQDVMTKSEEVHSQVTLLICIFMFMIWERIIFSKSYEKRKRVVLLQGVSFIHSHDKQDQSSESEVKGKVNERIWWNQKDTLLHHHLNNQLRVHPCGQRKRVVHLLCQCWSFVSWTLATWLFLTKEVSGSSRKTIKNQEIYDHHFE